MATEATKIRLPLHLKWSGPREYDLDDPCQRLRVYEIVLREGRAPDIARYIDPDEVLRLWDQLVLPPRVRVAWADFFELKRGIHVSLAPISAPGG